MVLLKKAHENLSMHLTLFTVWSDLSQFNAVSGSPLDDTHLPSGVNLISTVFIILFAVIGQLCTSWDTATNEIFEMRILFFLVSRFQGVRIPDLERKHELKTLDL